MGGYNSCKKCSRNISRYTIDREIDHPNGLPATRTYNIKLCWGCGYFSIYPNVRDEFTEAIMKNRFLIIELIEEKKLKPIL
jgi:hypothetical protein